MSKAILLSLAASVLLVAGCGKQSNSAESSPATNTVPEIPAATNAMPPLPATNTTNAPVK